MVVWTVTVFIPFPLLFPLENRKDGNSDHHQNQTRPRLQRSLDKCVYDEKTGDADEYEGSDGISECPVWALDILALVAKKEYRKRGQSEKYPIRKMQIFLHLLLFSAPFYRLQNHREHNKFDEFVVSICKKWAFEAGTD